MRAIVQLHVDMKSTERDAVETAGQHGDIGSGGRQVVPPGGQMEIGDLAAAYGLATHVLRHWEQMGVLLPARSGGGRRRYGPAEVARVALILLGKKAGLSLEQIRELLGESADRAGRQELYRRHHEELSQRIAAARASLDIIEHALECPAEDFTTCPAFRSKVVGQIPERLRA